MPASSDKNLAPGLFPGEVAVAYGDPATSIPLRPAEAGLVSRAVEKRRLEFANGRECARSALALLGGPEVDILMGDQREPVWPTGFVGSLTHTDGFCAAAVARRDRFLAVGIDAEPDVPLEPNIAERVSTDSEIARAAAYVGNDQGRAAHLVFSAKEAFYKCQFPLSRTFLGFEDVRLDVEGDALLGVLLKEAGPFAVGTTFRGRWQRRGSLFLTAFWLVAD